jgi:hypothetical protein
MRCVPPYSLWLGHADNGRDFGAIVEAGIEALVHLALEEPAVEPPRDLIYVRIPLVDGEANPIHTLALAIRIVAELLTHRVPTLVCCGAGLSRSPCIAAAALALVSGESFEGWLRRVQGQGPCDISPAFACEVERALDLLAS